MSIDGSFENELKQLRDMIAAAAKNPDDIDEGLVQASVAMGFRLLADYCLAMGAKVDALENRLKKIEGEEDPPVG